MCAFDYYVEWKMYMKEIEKLRTFLKRTLEQLNKTDLYFVFLLISTKKLNSRNVHKMFTRYGFYIIFNAVYLWIQHYWLFILCLCTQLGTEDRSEKNNISVSEKHTVYFLNKVAFNTMWRKKRWRNRINVMQPKKWFLTVPHKASSKISQNKRCLSVLWRCIGILQADKKRKTTA